MWLFVNNQHCFGYIQITTLNNKNTFGAPYLFGLEIEIQSVKFAAYSNFRHERFDFAYHVT